MAVDFKCRASLSLHIAGCRWYAHYIGMDNYATGWTTGDVDYY